MLRFGSVVLLAVCVICTSQAAVAQAPFIENYYGAGGSAFQTITSLEFVDIAGTEKTVTVPAGRAVIFWTVGRAIPDAAMIRPMIGSHGPDPAAIYYGGTAVHLSGTWTTNTEGGTITVRLQGALAYPGANLAVEQIEGTSWTLIVFPEAPGGVPAVTHVGLVVLVALLLGVGAFIIVRRRQASAT